MKNINSFLVEHFSFDRLTSIASALHFKNRQEEESHQEHLSTKIITMFLDDCKSISEKLKDFLC